MRSFRKVGFKIMMCNREIIGNKIKSIRQKKGLTQVQLSEMSKLARTTISKIEAGKFNASIDLLEKLIKPLGAELDIKEVD